MPGCGPRWLPAYACPRLLSTRLTGAQYSGKEVEDLEAKVDRSVMALVRLIETRYVSANRPFDFGRKAHYFTLDVITDLAFGEPFGDLATDSDVHGYIATLESAMPAVMLTTVLPWLLDLLSWPLFRRMLPSDKDAAGMGRTMAYVSARGRCGQR